MKSIKFKSKKGTDLYKFEMTSHEFLAMQDDYQGCCVYCGDIADTCEPDAERYECESCGKRGVFGISGFLMLGFVTIVDENEVAS